MDIYNKEPISVLTDYTKGLLYDKNGHRLIDGIPIYKEIMHEEEEDVPQSYILLRSQLSDTVNNYGDGDALVRTADCDIILVTKGFADDSTDLHNVNKNKIRQHLKSLGVNFQEFNLGYEDSIKSTQHTFSLVVNYIA